MQDCCESRFALYSIYVIWKEITVEGFSEEALYLQTRHRIAVQSDGDRRASKQDRGGPRRMTAGWSKSVRTSWMNIAITIYVDDCLLNACLVTGLTLLHTKTPCGDPFKSP
jgi:hypothetical protein